jgi:hypothetical protein
MARTPYQKENGDYSDKSHQLAQALIYPSLFDTSAENITYEEDTLLTESARGAVLDGEMGIDRVLRVTVPGLTGNIPFTVQERFRRPEFHGYQDLTITEWNHNSNLPSELYKIRANIFIYGYGNHPLDPSGFIEAIAINTTQLLVKISRREIPYTLKQNKKNQTFLAFSFDSLEKSGVVLWHKKDLSEPVRIARHITSKYSQEWISEFVSAINGVAAD